MANIDTAFAPFDDNYFAGIQSKYNDYALPQLQDQYNQAKNNIVFSLARKGNLNSSTAGDLYGELDRENATNLVGIEGAGKDYANQARSAVEANRKDITGQLNTTYDADSANNLALTAAKSLAVAKPSFSPLGQLFQNISAVAAQNRLASDPYGAAGPTGGARTFGSGASPSYSRYG
jgi:hypothetical protein